MIYLYSNTIILPNLENINSNSYVIELRNNVTNEISYVETQNYSTNELYYMFDLDVSNLADNEYTLNLYNDSSVKLGTFLAQKGISSKNSSVFEDETKYIQFEG